MDRMELSKSFETVSMDIYLKGDCASSLQSTRHIYGRKAMPCVKIGEELEYLLLLAC